MAIDPDQEYPAARRERILASYRRTHSQAATSRETGTTINVVRYALARAGMVAGMGQTPGTTPGARMSPAMSPMLPDPAPEAGGPTLPDPLPLSYEPVRIDTAGTWLVLGDVHLPFHDKKTVELAVEEGRRRQITGVLLNGDILDSGEISEHDKNRSIPDYIDEVKMGIQFLAWLRSRFPGVRLVFKQGNHDFRLERYIVNRAPALEGLEGFDLPSLLHLADYGIEWVQDKRVIAMGKLNVIHGHEYRGGISTPVNPARGLYLKARSVALCGHWHRTSEHHSRNIAGRSEAAWSVGCACYLQPAWNPLNDWNLGFALVTLEPDGNFVVENRRVLAGKVV